MRALAGPRCGFGTLVGAARAGADATRAPRAVDARAREQELDRHIPISLFLGAQAQQPGSPASTACRRPLAVCRPTAATQPSALSGFSLPRNLCVTAGPYTHGGGPFPEYCGYPHIHCSDGSVLNASATIGEDRSSIVLSAQSINCTAVATSYGRADWPMTVFFTEGEKGLPVIPWYAAIGVNNSWTPP